MSTARLTRHLAFALIATMMIIAVVVNAPIRASALSVDACNCVIFRLDDIQDFWLVPVQSAIIDKFIERNENLDLGVIMNFVGNDPAIVNKVRQGVATGLIETVLHGWNHVPYDTLSLQEQHDTLQMANAKLQDLFGRKTTIFIPPYNAYNEDTLEATSQLGLKIISSEFDQELPSIYDPDDPNSPNNKVYKAIAGSDIKDQFGVYHLPQVVGYYTYDSEPPTKTPLSFIQSQINDTIANYGYAVITLHPQDFTVKDANGNPTPVLSQEEMNDLDALITWIGDQEYHIRTFSSVTNVPLPPIIDNIPPNITAPADKAVVSTSELTPVDLGTPAVSDNVDTSPTVTNDAPAGGFPQGLTVVTWTATDDAGNGATANQYVMVSSTADTVRPTVSVSNPVAGTAVSGPAAGVNILVEGTASDGQSGVKIVEVRPNNGGYKPAKQKSPGSWSEWSFVLNIKQSGNREVVARSTDFFGNMQWAVIPITVSLSGPDTVAPQLTPPPDITVEAVGNITAVNLGAPVVFDNSDPAPVVKNDSPGATESTGFPLGTTVVTWTATDASGNSATAEQRVTVVDTSSPGIPELLSPSDGMATSNGAITFSWSQVTDATSGTAYDLLVSSSPDFSPAVIDQQGLTGLSYTLATPLADGTYYWKVRSSDELGNASPYSPARTVTVDTLAPAVAASPPGGTYSSARSVTLTASEPGATIYYTIDGSVPTTGSTVYSSPVSISINTSLKFFAVDPAGNGGQVATESYVFASVSASPPGGVYNAPQSVTLSSGVPGSTIYYTTDGSTPTTGSTVYTAPIAISANTTLRFFDVDGGGNAGSVVTEAYAFDTVAPTVTATPPGGTYSAAQSVALAASEPAMIYYTTDGSVPTTSSTVYTAPIAISADTILRFFGVDSAGNAGSTVTAEYIIDTVLPTVTADPAGGLYNAAISVTLTASEPGATIYYTTDGSVPTTGSTVYTAPISLSANTDLKFFAKDAVGNTGAVGSQTYLFDLQVPTVIASPTGGVFTSPQSVTLIASEPATVYYTTDGTDPTTSSPVYSSPISIAATATLKFFARDGAGNSGPIGTETYSINASTLPATHMSDTTATFGQSMYSAQQAHAEFVSPASQLVGKTIDEITLKLRKTGAPTGTAQVGVFNTDLTVKKLFGEKDTTTISSTYTDYVFSLTGSDVYVIQSGDRIGIKYAGGDASNFVAVMLDQDGVDPFDGTNTYRQVYTSSWLNSLPNDLYMTLRQTHAGADILPPTVTASPPGGAFPAAPSVTLSADETATIYYTLDGSTPTQSSSVYSSPITVSSGTTLRFFAKDTAGNIGSIKTEIYTVDPSLLPATYMSDTTATSGQSTYSAQQAHTEFVTPSSQLIGKSIDQITLKLRKTGVPTGIAEIGIFNTDLTVKKLFGTQNASAITSTYTDYVFSLTGSELYTIQSGDRIGIKYAGGDASNFVAVMLDRDAADPFDGTNTYRQVYTSSWLSSTSDDLYMILKQTHG